MVLASKKDMERLYKPDIWPLMDEYERVCGKRPPPYNCVQWICVDEWIQALKDAIAKGPEGEAVPLRDFPDDIF